MEVVSVSGTACEAQGYLLAKGRAEPTFSISGVTVVAGSGKIFLHGKRSQSMLLFFLCVYKMAGGWMDDQCLEICKDGVFGSWVGELRKNANDLGTNLTAVEMEV
jgi:hypothetical protein